MNRDVQRLELILRLINSLERRLAGQPREALLADDRDELDLTAFRLLHIGENSGKLSVELKDRHPEIPWAAIYQLRNVVAHGYDQIDPAKIWGVIGPKLLQLKVVCKKEIAASKD